MEGVDDVIEWESRGRAAHDSGAPFAANPFLADGYIERDHFLDWRAKASAWDRGWCGTGCRVSSAEFSCVVEGKERGKKP